MQKIDLTKEDKEYFAARKRPFEFYAGPVQHVSVSGIGEPGGEAFVAAIEKVFSIVYTAKFTLLKAGVMDFLVCTLECRWGDMDPETTPRDKWPWAIEVRVPLQFTQEHLDKTREVVAARKKIDLSDVRLLTTEDGRCVQGLHVGSYDTIEATYKALTAFADGLGAQPRALCRELYISDPRRCKPENLKTIIRLGVEAVS